MIKQQTINPKKTPKKRWDKRQRICSLVDEGEEEEDEEDEMKSAHTAFRLQQLRAKVRFVHEIHFLRNTELRFGKYAKYKRCAPLQICTHGFSFAPAEAS